MQTTSSLKYLRKLYRQLDNIRLELEQHIEEKKEELGLGGEPEGARAWVENGVLRITVDECLPRIANGTSKLRLHWINKITKALISIEAKFEKALCVIAVYSPFGGNWDVDNRAYNYVINALRYARVIDDDNYHNLTFMVTGQVDKEYPRTEIYVLEYSLDVQTFVSKLINGH